MAKKNDELLAVVDDPRLEQNEGVAHWLGSLGLAAAVLATGAVYCRVLQAWPLGQDSNFIMRLTDQYGIIAHPAMHVAVTTFCCFLPRIFAAFKNGRIQGLIAISLWVMAFSAAIGFVWIGVAFQFG